MGHRLPTDLETFYVAYLHTVFFHVLAALVLNQNREATKPVKVPPRLAGNWIYSTVPVAGQEFPLQLAALPATAAVSLADGKKVAPYLVIYCQRGAARPLNAFLDMRLPVALEGKAIVKLNGKDFPAFAIAPLIEGDASRLSLPHDLTPLLREAVQLEVLLPGYNVNFVLLNWPKMRERLDGGCRAN